VDQDAGEQDISQYIIWRRLASEPNFSQPLLVVAVEADAATYTTVFTDQVPGSSYVFGIAAQDCTPAMSSISTASVNVAAP
jgi:hypothetical protein